MNFAVLRKSIIFKLFLTVGVSYVFYLLSDYLFPLFLAIALAFLLNPLVRQFEKLSVSRGTLRVSRGVAIFLSFVTFLVILGLFVAVIAPPLLNQANSLLEHLPELAARAHIQNWQALLRDGTLPDLPRNLNSLADSALGWTMGILGNTLRKLLYSSMDIVANLVGLVVVPFLSFYILKDWQQLCDMLVDLFAPELQPQARHVLFEIGGTLANYVIGLGKMCLISGLVILAGVTVIGLDYPLIFGCVAVLSECIPVFGPVVGGAAAIFTAYDVSVHMAVQVAVFYAVYYLFDANVLMPRLVGAYVDLPAVILLIAIMVGGKLFGIIGMLFAVPLAAVYRVLYKELWH